MDIFSAFVKGFAKGTRKADGTPSEPPSKGNDTPPDVIKDPPMTIDGRCMSAEEFVHYVEGLVFPQPLPTRIFLHHTWKPTKADWDGHNTILAMKAYYDRQLWTDDQGRVHEGWGAGPHLFVAEDGIWLFSDIREDGVGVYGQNYRTRHLEMVGDYDNELPGGATLTNTIAALGILHARLGLDISNLGFHRDFSTKTCPGRAVQKEWIIPQVAAWIKAYQGGRESQQGALRQSLRRMMAGQLIGINPNAALAKAGAARGLLGAITDEIPMEINAQAYIVQFYAEALLVPVNQWDKVQSLDEFEARNRAAALSSDDEEQAAGPQLSAPPHDPHDFQGKIR